MWELDGWTERDHIHVWIGFFEQPTLKTRVDHHDIRFVAINAFIHITENMHDFRISIGFPARVSTRKVQLCPRKLCQRLQHALDLVAA
ncbi:Uncharacterised protein [Vibrio cholerae]|uniref:Uncharacterized protein n=1 Tax=Vibrio cholerae TaxID=666 RepID=A0A655XBF3_VIBCL|nr:Uncharacterised protein [Vibrio cholerae]CSB78723.1 Uncharacterised protein [Vibrio cholerae]CSC09674.1 Uncharacterised protein [Vibrio cholerae]CSD28907.1 Uncharacterised protein [Vibrio cholerae]